MKVWIFILSLAFTSITCNAQEEALPDIEAHFAACIVKDMDTSLSWYSEMLGFKTVNKKVFPEAGFKQANLKRGQVAIELIELDTALSAEAVIPNYQAKTRLIGIFKIGFLISDFDVFITHLTKNQVQFHGQVVTNEISGKRMVIIKDPDGNRIQLFEK